MSYPKLTKKGWDAIPPEYIYFAVDSTGDQYVYIDKPELNHNFNYWIATNGAMFFKRGTKCDNWQNSLQKRPTTNELSKTIPTPHVTHVRLSMADFERIAKDFGLTVRHCETYCDAAMYSPAGQISIVFVADVPVNVTVHDSVNGIPVTVHDQI